MEAEPSIDLVPETVDELRDAVRGESCILPVGGGSKGPLSRAEGAKPVSLRKLSGIIEYDPCEFTFTAWAGTPVEEVKAALAEKGQYLPFAPVLGERGATLGGSVASGLSGSGRFRFGGIRDFLLGARLVDGTGRLITTGGKVVKNAAGFDIPKLMVGSLGRLGILAELTFKVFPAPASTVTVALDCSTHAEAQGRLVEAACSCWELDALDYQPGEKALLMRVGGPEAANGNSVDRIAKRWGGAKRLGKAEAAAVWGSLRAFEWAAPGSILAKVPTTPGQLPALLDALERIENVKTHIAAGGMCAWIAVEGSESLAALDGLIKDGGWTGLVFRGAAPRLWLGERVERRIDRELKSAFDPDGRFPEF